jgi:hypothetical protein
MTTTWQTHRVLGIAFAVLGALLSVAFAYPRAVSDPALGSDWQCHRTIFVTSCTRAKQIVPTAQNFRMERIHPLWV